MAQVVWSDSAIQDLNDIGDYIAKDSIRYAEITILNLFESVDILETHPLAGNMVPEFEDIDILTVHNSARLISNSYPFKKRK